MTYDYHGHWDKATGHVSPMYGHPEDKDATFNTNYTIHHWLKNGADRKKLVLGMPLYGQAFTLDDSDNHGLNAPARQKGAAGEFTRAAGFLAYYEICNSIKNRGYNVVTDPEGRIGPYAYKERQWVGYDDKKMIKYKSEYVRKLGLGGGMVWALDLDDFNNRCGEGKHPLLSTIRDVLQPAIGKYEGIVDGSGLDADNSRDSNNENDQQENEDNEEQENEEKEEQEKEEMNEASNEMEEISEDSEYKVVCYYTNWAFYRPGAGKYKPENIDASLCTHIVYGFAVLNPNTLLIRPHDAWADKSNKFYEQVTGLKNEKKKVLLAIGGWNDSKGDKYSKLVATKETRSKFIEHVVEFLKENNFDGLDLDWEYPVCWQVDCEKGPKADKENFAAWIKEMKMAFEPHGLLLTAAVTPSKMVVDEGYDVPAASKYLDYVSVMSYDYHGQWDKKTGHVAPMYDHPLNNNAYFNVNYTVNYWIEKGLERKKLIMGLPMYGQSFSLASSNDNGLQAPSYGGGSAGQFTRARGFLAYYEICNKIQNDGWKMIRDPQGRMGPYAFKGNQWVGFDDVIAIRQKSQYIKENKLGGAMIWALDLDDFSNQCNCEPHPLLRTINRVLGRLPGKGPECNLVGSFRIQEQEDSFIELPAAPYNKCNGNNMAAVPGDCSKFKVCDNEEYKEQDCAAGLHFNKKINACDWPANAGCSSSDNKDEDEDEDKNQEQGTTATTPTTAATEKVTTQATVPTKTTPAVPDSQSETQGQTNVPDTGYKVVCYFTNWAWYRNGIGKYTPEDIDPSLCTHVNYGFSVLDPNTLLMKPHDTWADLDNKFYEKVVALKKKGVKVLMAIGGWNDSEGNKYSRMVNDASARARFIAQAVEFIEEYGFDGLDLDWEYPKCWQVDCDKGPYSDKENFGKLVKELSKEFKPRGWLLTAAVSPSKAVIDQAYDVPVLNKYLDIWNVMSYDYHGHWDKMTGHVSPLKDYEGSNYDYFNSEFTLEYYVQKGADPKKLVMGMPMYGQAFTLKNPNEHGLNAPARKGQAGQFTKAAGFISYYEICTKIKTENWNVVKHDEENVGPYAYKGNQWVGFDDIAMIRRKSEFVKENGYGGGMIWALDLDDFNNVCGCEKYPLLRTINRVLRNYPSPDPQCPELSPNVIKSEAQPYQNTIQTGPQSPFYSLANPFYSHPNQFASNPFVYNRPQSSHPYTGHYNSNNNLLYNYNVLYKKK